MLLHIFFFFLSSAIAKYVRVIIYSRSFRDCVAEKTRIRSRTYRDIGV
jgi:hypothetical protein